MTPPYPFSISRSTKMPNGHGLWIMDNKDIIFCRQKLGALFIGLQKDLMFGVSQIIMSPL